MDLVNVKEEMVILCGIANMWNLEDIMHTNIDKLKVRFTNENALNRDLKKERSILDLAFKGGESYKVKKD